MGILSGRDQILENEVRELGPVEKEVKGRTSPPDDCQCSNEVTRRYCHQYTENLGRDLEPHP